MDNNVKTGTTILGIVCKDGVVMAGDNRVTMGGQLISDKNFKKVIQVNDYLLVSVCGHAQEAIKISKLLKAELKLKELRTKKRPTVREAASLLSNIPAQGSAFIVSGIDRDKKVSVYDVLGGMSKEVKDYTASVGSGLMYVLGYLERQYKAGITIEEGIHLATESIKAASARDVASGNGLDIFTITKTGIKKAVSQKVESVYKDKE